MKTILIDGNSLINRAYYATPLNLTDGKGMVTNAIYGFFNMFFKVLEDFAPDRVGVAFDLKAKTFRHLKYPDYKGTRKPTPKELLDQFPVIKDLLKKLNIAIYEKEGFEADDLLGTLSKTLEGEISIITGDNDYLQLISDNVKILFTKKGITDLDEMTEKTLREKKSLAPWQIVELKGLMGDASDNIPGVAGIGEKTAMRILNAYDSIDGLYLHIDREKGKVQEKLIAGKDLAYLSKDLATIDTAVPMEIKNMEIKTPFSSEAKDAFLALNIKTIVDRSPFFEGVPKIERTEVVTVSGVDEIPQINEGEVSFHIDGSFFLGTKEKSYKILLGDDLLSELFFDSTLVHLKSMFENPNVKKILFDSKEIRKILAKLNITLENFEDVMLLSYCGNYIPSLHTLSDISRHYGEDDENPGGSLLKLKDKLLALLKKENLESLYFDIEKPLSLVLYEMEKEGFKIDREQLEIQSEKIKEILDKTTQKIYSLAGEEFNINSPKQLGEVLFDHLNLHAAKKKKTIRSTGVEVLESLRASHPIIEEVLLYRKFQKLQSTYIEGMKSQIESDGKIHTIFNQALTTTGRLSSKEPNLQNIPIRTEEGKELRRLFVASKDLLVAADYSQIELRLLAHFSKDEKLISSFLEGKDIHSATACEILGVSEENLTKDMRRMAKAVNFGIIYGISSYGLATNLGITSKDAKIYMDTYFARYPRVKGYLEQSVEDAKEKGYAVTFTGRMRAIPQLKSSNFVQRSFGERAAMNMPLQGSSAEIIKIAMIRVFNRLKKENLTSRLILQIHDELLVDTKLEELEQVKRILKEEMENFSFAVPLNVSCDVGKTWYET